MDTNTTLADVPTRLRPYSATALALGGTILVILGMYFLFLRPPLLPEDLRSMGTSLAQVQATMPVLHLATPRILGNGWIYVRHRPLDLVRGDH